MIVSMIAAMARNGVIGKDNQMPWHLPADFIWFKRCTMGKPIIMGRKTFESIGRPLPGRLNIVVTRRGVNAEGVEVVSSIDAAIALAASKHHEVMIIGGGSIYKTCLPHADKLYLTIIDEDIEGDTRFPEIGGKWDEVYRERYPADEKNAYDMSFITLEKKK
ncbi:type 3 dihydrofolate reductase [Vibrio salinus]|uniref:type 3 dihydrofolate reductase n=1 Tax=Vibrio salinus TaxID=2899784 RepID=UPI001E5CC2B7|nr:type 3 dihydrofolate reductase [Vibrio salinus]MCE0494112.1 type 3 dihydrofolate reductase [Vibrio salinus]